MHSIPLNLKQLLFNKGAEEDLTSQEQKLWEEFVESEQPENAWIEPEDPLFRDALELHFHLKEEKFTIWEKFEQRFFKQSPAPLVVKQGKIMRMFKHILAYAVALLLVIGAWLYVKYAPSESQYLSLNTPNGKVDSINLPDGTTVYLNGGSTIIYPAVFTKDERLVELKGEAYFRVENNPVLPFHVKAGKTDIIAVGTVFNVKAYDGEDTVKATLIEGKIKIKNGDSTIYIGPAPGQQAIVVNGIISADSVNVNTEVAWKNGIIILENQTIQSILQQIHHSYGVDVDIIGNPLPINIKGQISKKESLAEVINIINNAAGKQLFHIEGEKVKKVIVREH